MGRTASVQGQQALYSRAGADLSRDVPLAIVGGTLIDVRDYGRSTEDIAESTILTRRGRIERVGESKDVAIPRDARVDVNANTC